MRLGQIKWQNEPTAAIFEGGLARPIHDHSLFDLLRRAEMEGVPLTALAQQQASSHTVEAQPIIPIQPREVWACGCTYQTSSSFRDGESGQKEGFYDYVYRHPRPEIFMKGTSRVCVGPGQAIGVRADSHFTAPEPELALLIGSKGRILAYTLGNDVSAWDIERENPLYLTQSKVFSACCSLGPTFVTVDQVPDPYALEITCHVRRREQLLFSGSFSTSMMNRKLEALLEYLLRSNPVPSGSLLLTGTGLIVPQQAALAPGDTVTIRCEAIGELENTVARV